MTVDSVLPLKTNKDSLSGQAYRYLLGLIRDGVFRPGEQLPSQNELAAQLGISRSTLREALLKLEQQGLVVRRHGVGTFIAPGYGVRLASGLERLESILKTAARQGMQLGVDALQVEERPADEEQAALLQVEPGTMVTSVRRVLQAEGTPIAYMHDVITASILPQTAIHESFNGSVLDALRQQPGLHISQATATIVAVNADTYLARQLGVNRRQALLLMEEQLFDDAGRVVEFSHNYFVPDFFQFYLVRR